MLSYIFVFTFYIHFYMFYNNFHYNFSASTPSYHTHHDSP